MRKPTLEQRFSIRNYERTAEMTKAKIAQSNRDADAEAVKRRHAIEDHQERLAAKRQLEGWGVA